MMMAKIYHCESHSKRLISSKIDKQLYRIILFQTIFDCTYMGEYFRRKNDGKKFQKYFTTLFTIIQETIYGIPAALLWYLSATSYSADYLFEETAVHNTMRYLFSLFHFCILIETLSVKLTNIFRGHRIIAIIQDIGSNINLSSSSSGRSIFYYRLIYLYMAIIMILYGISFCLFANITQTNSTSILITFAISGSIYGINVSWVTTIHLYTAILVNERFQSE